MSIHHHKLQKLGSAAFALAALCLLGCAVLWPPPIAEVFRARWAVTLFALWSGGFAFLIHPELSAGLAMGIREFRKAMRDVIREMRGGNDDDDPHAG